MSDIGRYYDESLPPSIFGPPVVPVPATGATAGAPGIWTPPGSVPPADAAGATATGVVASPATDWTVGQYVQGSTAGVAGEMNWNGTAWVAGRSAVTAAVAAEPQPEAAAPAPAAAPAKKAAAPAKKAPPPPRPPS